MVTLIIKYLRGSKIFSMCFQDKNLRSFVIGHREKVLVAKRKEKNNKKNVRRIKNRITFHSRRQNYRSILLRLNLYARTREILFEGERKIN